jgi:hypothetical protein
MVVTERNFFVGIASAVLFTDAIRELYNKQCYGINRKSTWFMATLKIILAMALLMFLR